MPQIISALLPAAFAVLVGGASLPSLRLTPRHVRAPALRLATDEPAAPASAPYRPARIDEAQLRVGQIVECAVLGKLAPAKGQRLCRGYIVDIGASRPALVPRTHVALRPNATSSTGINVRQGWAELPVDTVLEGQILSIEEGEVNVSFARVQHGIAWERVGQLADLDATVNAKVLRLGEAGAILDVENLVAFLPWSHWSVPPEDRSWKLHGTTLPVKFLETDRAKRRLVVSHRRVKLEQATASLEPGNVVEGTVKEVKQYGAVVRLASGVEGLLHVSQISQTFVKNVSDCFQPGAPVCCVVINVDAEDGSISLSTKMLESRPGEMVKNATAVYERAAATAASN